MSPASIESSLEPDPAAILRRVDRLRDAGGRALAALSPARLEAAFLGAVAAFRDPGSEERRRLDPPLREAVGLSQGCLDASLEALLDGFTTAEVRAVLTRARGGSGDRADPSPAPHLLVLAANLPGLLLQPLLASLAVRRSLLVKSSTREPVFAQAFAAALTAREPTLEEAVAAMTWRGGETAIEAPLLARVDRVVAYGASGALADLRRRAGQKLIAFGPKASVAVIGGSFVGERLDRLAASLARDVALFEQRGCLSLQAVYVDGDASALARALAGALDEAARRWPPPELSPSAAAAVRLAREEAEFLGFDVAPTPLERATVLLHPRAIFLPAVGHRTVRVHPVPDLETASDVLRPYGARLQGAAVAGTAATDAFRRHLTALGVSYLCAPGRLQSPGASWANGGIDLVEALAAPR